MNEPNEMTEAELRDFLAQEVMDWKRDKFFWVRSDGVYMAHVSNWNPQENPADAMAVLEKCLSKLENKAVVVNGTPELGYHVEGYAAVEGIFGVEKTLPLSICQFAYRLFKKD